MTLSNVRLGAGAARGIGRSAVLSATGLLFLASASCGPGNGTSEPTSDRVYWIVTHSEPENSFWGPLQQGMLDAAEDLGVSAEFKGAAEAGVPPAEQQARIVRQAITEGVDGIGITMTDPAVLAAPIQEAAAAGIPVIAVNIPLSTEDQAEHDIPILGYVGQVETVMAEKASLHALELLAAEGRTADVALCIQGSVNLAWAVQRCQGMTDALEPLGIEVTTLAGNFFDQPPDVPTSTIEEWFTNNPGVDFVFSTATPVLNLLLSMQADGTIAEDVLIGSVDLNEETLDAIRTGRCAFAVDQQPYMQGYMAVTTLELNRTISLRPGADIQTGPFFVESDNVEEIARLVSEGVR